MVLTRCLQDFAARRWDESNPAAERRQDLNHVGTSGERGTMESSCLFVVKMERSYLQMEHCEDIVFLSYQLGKI